MGKDGHETAGKILKGSTAVVAILLGIYLGYWVAALAFSWLSSSAKEVGKLWGSGVAAVVALWKAAADTIDTLRGAIRYSRGTDKSFDHLKALSNVATTSFGVALGYLTLASSATGPGVSPVELVYVVSHQGKEAPSFLMAPTLVFASARLRDPNMKDYSDPKDEITRGLFEDRGVSLSPSQIESATKLVKNITECTFDGAKETIELKVCGFANDLPIVDGTKANRKDSDRLNLAVANFRGESLFRALRTFVSTILPELKDEIVIQWVPWVSLSEMKYERDNRVFRNFQISVSSEIDHRSAVIVVLKAGRCPNLITPTKESQ